MKVFRGLPNAAARAPCALTIGNFDGVHRGHQALLARVREAASKLDLEAAVMTFEPHPREFFAQLAGDPSKAPTRIANLRDKLQSLDNAGIDRVIVEHFNAHFAAMPPQDFIEKVLVQGPAREMADGRRGFLLRRHAAPAMSRRCWKPAASTASRWKPCRR